MECLSIGESGLMPAQFSTTLIPPNVPTLEEMLYIGCIRHIGLDGDGLAGGYLNFDYYFFGLGRIAKVHYDHEAT
jgi:hypothetical protein